jgi:hypothetical protein
MDASLMRRMYHFPKNTSMFDVEARIFVTDRHTQRRDTKYATHVMDPQKKRGKIA